VSRDESREEFPHDINVPLGDSPAPDTDPREGIGEDLSYSGVDGGLE